MSKLTCTICGERFVNAVYGGLHKCPGPQRTEKCPFCDSSLNEKQVEGKQSYTCDSHHEDYDDKIYRTSTCYDRELENKDRQIANLKTQLLDYQTALKTADLELEQAQAELESETRWARQYQAELQECREKLEAYKEYMLASESGWIMEKHKAKYKLRNLGEI